MELRDYQQSCIDSMLKHTEGNILIKAPTGAGKTVIMGSYLKKLGRSALVLAHRTILVKQAKDTFKRIGLKGVDVMTFQTAVRRDLKQYDVIVIDEVHRLPPTSEDSSYRRILENVPNARLVGFTATPFRLGQGHIYGTEDCWFEELCFDIELRHLQGQGYLCPYDYLVAGSLEVRARRSGGDYNLQDLEEELGQELHLGSVKHAIDEHCQGRTHIAVFAVTIGHAEALANHLGGMVIHSKMTKDARRETLAKFSVCGGILVSVASLTEGWDEPRCDVVILARPTLSPALYVQMVGRGLRIHPSKKDCLVLDMVGCYNRHGSINNPKVLEPGERSEETEVTIRDEVCQNCGHIMPSPPTCGFCGHTNMSQAEVAIINERLELKAINEDVATIRDIWAEWYTARSGSRCIRINIETEEFGIIRDYFAVRSNKVTPRRKARQAYKYLFGYDCLEGKNEREGWDEVKWDGMVKAVRLKALKTNLIGVNEEGGYWRPSY